MLSIRDIGNLSYVVLTLLEYNSEKALAFQLPRSTDTKFHYASERCEDRGAELEDTHEN